MTKSSSKFKVQSSKLNNTPRATTMAELMKSARTPFVYFHKGDQVSGIITKLAPSEILLDINAKTEALVLEKDKKILSMILSSLKVGDRVEVTVLSPEGDLGNPVVSIRKFIYDMFWERALTLEKNKEILDTKVDLAIKGGFLVKTENGISGFLPNSHVSNLENPLSMVGKNIKTVILKVNRKANKIIFSQKQVLGIEDFRKYIKGFKIGQQIDAIITNITSFGIFLSLPVSFEKSSGETREAVVIEGFIHTSEISWKNVTEVPDNFKVSQKVKAVITGFDEESRRILLSIKRLSPDPFELKLKEYPLDKKVKAEVAKVLPSGVLLDLGKGVVGIIKKDKIPPSLTYKEGEEIQVLVADIDKERCRVVVVPVLLEKPIGYR